jgi:hypothetical protein
MVYCLWGRYIYIGASPRNPRGGGWGLRQGLAVRPPRGRSNRQVRRRRKIVENPSLHPG